MTIIDITDEPRKRTIHLENGNKYNIEQTDPYGFWIVRMESGQVPEVLKQSFTDCTLALQAVARYVESRKTKDEKIEKTEKIEKNEKAEKPKK